MTPAEKERERRWDEEKRLRRGVRIRTKGRTPNFEERDGNKAVVRFNSRLPIHYGKTDGGVAEYSEHFRPYRPDGEENPYRKVCVIATVRSGDAQMVRRFWHYLLKSKCNAKPIGADERAETDKPLATDFAGKVFYQRVERRNRDGTVRHDIVAQAIPADQNHKATSEYLLWGYAHDLADFVQRNVGEHKDGKCIASVRCNAPVVVCTASGAAPASDNMKAKVRLSMQSQRVRREHDEAERLERLPASNPESPYHQHRERLAWEVARREVPVYLGTNECTDAVILFWTARIARFILKNDRVPTRGNSEDREEMRAYRD